MPRCRRPLTSSFSSRCYGEWGPAGWRPLPPRPAGNEDGTEPRWGPRAAGSQAPGGMRVTNTAPHTGVSKESWGGRKEGHVGGLGGTGRGEVETPDGPQPRKVGLRGWARGKQTRPTGLTENQTSRRARRQAPRRFCVQTCERLVCAGGSCVRACVLQNSHPPSRCVRTSLFPFLLLSFMYPVSSRTTAQPSMSCCFQSY